MDEQYFYKIITAVWLALSLISFIALLKISAPYGKFTRPGFGPIIGRTKGWILMELPALLSMPVLFFLGNRHSNLVAALFLGMWVTHYFYRTCVFPFRMRGEKRRVALIPVILGAIFNLGNGYLNGRYVFTISTPQSLDWLADPRFLLGGVLFVSGLIINIRSDAILRSLRRPGETTYKIPRGGMFRYISAANYFGEIIEWIGFAIATWSPGGLVFAIWTIANLLPRALTQHKWYRAQFENYPPERKALIPFLL